MLNNSALDVALGLIFIYAVYSLLATTLTELVASMLNQRGEILKKGIKRMLDNDDPQPAKSQEDEGQPSSDNPLDENLSPTFLAKPEIKYLGKKNLLGKTRFPSYLKSKTFVNTLLDTLGFAFSDKADLSVLKKKLNPKNETHKILINLIDQADNKVDKFKASVEEWYNETMERVSGWYKRRIQLITVITGVLIAFVLNVNTIEIAKVLGTDEDARVAMVQAASGYVTNLNNTRDTTSAQKSIEEINADVKELIQESNNVQSVMNLPYPSFKKGESSVTFWSYIIGCLATAIALSLGSPFWFDLLNKFVQMRGSGTQEKSAKSNNPPPKKPAD